MSRRQIELAAFAAAALWVAHFATMATLRGWPVAISLMLALVGTAQILAVSSPRA